MKTFPSNFFAHRGLHNALMPENSLAAFEHAIQKGYGIELDVHLNASGDIVVFHDETTNRMTGKEGCICNVKTSELDSYKLNGTNQTIPLLKNVLSLVNGAVPILLEIKNEGKVGLLEQTVIDTLAPYGGTILVQSFNPFTLRYFARHAPQYLRGQLSGHFKEDKMNAAKRFVLKYMLLNMASKPNFISYDKRYLTMRKLRRTKLPLFAWTVTSQAEANQLMPFCTHLIFEQFEPQITQTKKQN